MKRSLPPTAWQERAIQSKRDLLAYLRSQPKRLTIESYLCLTEVLRKGGWKHEEQSWHKAELRLPIQAATILELERQIADDEERLLRQTVRSYRAGEDGK